MIDYEKDPDFEWGEGDVSVIDGVKVMSVCTDTRTGITYPLSKVKEEFERHMMNVLPICETDQPREYDGLPKWLIMLDDKGDRKVYKRGEKEYEDFFAGLSEDELKRFEKKRKKKNEDEKI